MQPRPHDHRLRHKSQKRTAPSLAVLLCPLILRTVCVCIVRRSEFRASPLAATRLARAPRPPNTTIPPVLEKARIALPPPTYRAHVAHAVLVALVAVLLAGARAFPAVVPRRDA